MFKTQGSSSLEYSSEYLQSTADGEPWVWDAHNGFDKINQFLGKLKIGKLNWN